MALALASKNDFRLLERYLPTEDKNIDFIALWPALTIKNSRGRPIKAPEAAERAKKILIEETRWRKDNPGKRRPYRSRPRLIEAQVNAAWLEEGRWLSAYRRISDQAGKVRFEREYKAGAEAMLLQVLENMRKNRSRKPRKKTG
ncbi:hypothetical protein ACVWZ4_002507 [Bradyrhizobium sp. USDA 4472]